MVKSILLEIFFKENLVRYLSYAVYWQGGGVPVLPFNIVCEQRHWYINLCQVFELEKITKKIVSFRLYSINLIILVSRELLAVNGLEERQTKIC